MDYLQTLLVLMWAHYVGDFPLQGDFLANFKGKHDYILFSHVFIWTGCVCAALAYFGLLTWWKILFLFIVHFIADRYKARKTDKTEALTVDLWTDQMIHVGQIIVVSM